MTTILLSIVTYNNSREIGPLLSDIHACQERYRGGELRVLARLLDNASTDNTIEVIRDAGYSDSLIVGARNIGFGEGHNAIVSSMKEGFDILCVANPDVRFEPEELGKAARKLSGDGSIGLIAPKLVYPDGREQRLCKRDPTFLDIFLRRFIPDGMQGPFRKRLMRFTMQDMNYDSEFDLEYASGCFMILRGAAFQEAGGFDPRYFMYIEDADLTRAIRAAGYRAVYCPSIQVVHRWRRGSYHSLRLALINVISVLKYSWKWRRGGQAFRRAQRRVARMVS